MRPCDGMCAPVCGSLEGGKHLPHPDSGETQRSGFGGKRRSSGASELWPFLGRSERYGACDDESRRKFCRSFGGRTVTSARSAGRVSGFGLTLFPPLDRGVDAESPKPAYLRAFHDAYTKFRKER